MSRVGNYAVRFETADTVGSPTITTRVYAEHSVSTVAAIPFASQPEYMAGRASQPGNVTRNMFAAQRTRGPSELPYGIFELENADGGLDTLINSAMDGRPVYLHSFFDDGVGGYYTPYTGVMEQPAFNASTITITARGALFYTIARSILPTKYAGNNALPAGIEGTASDLKGKCKPMVLGIVRNVSPPCVNTSKLIYQVDGQKGLRTGWTMSVYDKRVALTAGAVYTSQADMETNAPAAGQYRVWPAGGCFRLGSTPAGQITADVTNPLAATGGSPLKCNPDAVTGNELHLIVYALLGYTNGVAYPSTPYLRSNMVSAPDGGVYLDSEMTGYDAINMLSASLSASWGSDHFQDGNSVDFLQLREPGAYTVTDFQGTSPSALSLTEKQISTIERVRSSDDDAGIPVWQVNLSYGKNWTVQSATDIGAATPADLAFVQQEYRTVTVSDVTVKSQWLNARILNVNTLIDNQTAATAEANRLLTLYKVRRDFFAVTIPLAVTMPVSPGQIVWTGQDVTVTHSRYGLSAGKLLRVIGVSYNYAQRTVTLTLWG